MHRQAALWYAQQNLLNEAIRHAFATDDFTLVIDLIEPALDQLVKQGEQALIATWLEKLPRDLCLVRPRLALAYSHILIIRRELVTAHQWLQQIAAALALGTPDPHLQGQLLYLQANAAARQFDFAQVIAYCEQGLQVVAADDWSLRARLLLELGVAFYYTQDMKASYRTFEEATRFALQANDWNVALYGINNQADALANFGRLDEAIRTFQMGLQLVQTHGLAHLVIANELHNSLVLVLYEVNQLAAMQTHVEETLRQPYYLNPVQRLQNQVSLAMLQEAQGAYALALTTIEQTMTELRDQKFTIEDASTAQFWQIHLWLVLERPAAALAWAATCGLDLANVMVTRLAEYMALVRIFFIADKVDAALALLSRLQSLAQTQERTSLLVSLFALQALALAAAGDAQNAQAILAAAIDRGRQGGYVRSFVLLGAPMQRLLNAYRSFLDQTSEASQRAYLDQLLAAFPAVKPQPTEPPLRSPSATIAKAAAPSARPDTTALVEPLSEREREVLRLVAAGLSNNQIAEQLIITTGTVKRHLNNIFGKLQVSSRTQAIAQARALDLF